MNTDKIKAILEQKNMTAYALAKKVGIPTSHMTKIMTNKVSDPRFDLVCRLADVLEVKVDDLRKPVNYER
ncbi:helix-turn-helix domain-containing protein [Enterococcus sp. AZ103]|uniref:helix-turn-helix domain-containing protein n=1 Tax=Enterococcus sp. AZ103 TaxID=2774628 RepID=UPI003F24009A